MLWKVFTRFQGLDWIKISLQALSAGNAMTITFLMVSNAFYGVIGLFTVLIDLSYGIVDPRIRMGAEEIMDKNEKKYSKDYFKLVHDEEILLDKPLKTKQLTYWQDTMSRFTKNKYNVIATAILALFILLSIFVPIFTPSPIYEKTNANITTLPPRVPLLEKIWYS